MSRHLERDLDNLQEVLLALAASVEEAIHKTTPDVPQVANPRA